MRRVIHGQGAEITANKITIDEKPIRRRGKHKGTRIVARRKVVIRVQKQNPQKHPTEEYPPEGTRIAGDHAVIETRMAVTKNPTNVNGRDRLVVDRGFDAEVTGNRILQWIRRRS